MFGVAGVYVAVFDLGNLGVAFLKNEDHPTLEGIIYKLKISSF